MFVEPKISIIIPVYNVEKYLCECIDSILNQTFHDFEIICVDDGSIDKTLEILRDYKNKDERIFILQQHHSGAAEARNNGIKLARGKYVQFLDSDDYFEPTMLEELYNNAEIYNADLTVCSARKVNNDGEIVESGNPLWPLYLDKVPLNQIFSPEDFSNDIFNLFCVVPWNKLIKKDLIVDNDLKFQGLSSSNDVAFGEIVRICAKRIFVINREFINYRINRSGAISEYRNKNAMNVIRAALCVKDYLIAHNLYKKYKNSYVQAFTKHIGSAISSCSGAQYQEFLNQLKSLMPDDWVLFKDALKKDFITLDYLTKFIGNKRVLLWGASLFIRQILGQETNANPNILGFVDRNKASWGKTCGHYRIYSPEEIASLKPDGILLTVFSNNNEIYKSLQKEIDEKYSDIQLLPNIFEEEEC